MGVRSRLLTVSATLLDERSDSEAEEELESELRASMLISYD